jgi:hypothetical protein
MSRDNLEFNTIKTVGTINKDSILQKVFKKKFGDYNPNKLTDIEAKNGVATPLQKTMLNLGKLKTLNTNLLDKGVSDHYRGTKNLSDKDLRTINAAIRDFEKKISMIK